MRRPGVRIPLPPVFARRRREERGLSRRSLGEGGPFDDLVNANAASYDSASQWPRMARFFYIYILQSECDEHRFYTGLTDDLRKRVQNHNSGRVLHTAKWRPWRLKAYIAFSDRTRAAQ